MLLFHEASRLRGTGERKEAGSRHCPTRDIPRVHHAAGGVERARKHTGSIEAAFRKTRHVQRGDGFRPFEVEDPEGQVDEGERPDLKRVVPDEDQHLLKSRTLKRRGTGAPDDDEAAILGMPIEYCSVSHNPSLKLVLNASSFLP